jgi:hypothetical protein
VLIAYSLNAYGKDVYTQLRNYFLVTDLKKIERTSLQNSRTSLDKEDEAENIQGAGGNMFV